MGNMSAMRDYTQGKSELVAWIVSNCRSKLRLSFVRELKKYIRVDVFGRYSSIFGQPRSCPKSNTTDCLKKYKFYLAFENALCEDYITEKYWRHLGKIFLFLFSLSHDFINSEILRPYYRYRTCKLSQLVNEMEFGEQSRLNENEGKFWWAHVHQATRSMLHMLLSPFHAVLTE